jgi:CrcB protein
MMPTNRGVDLSLPRQRRAQRRPPWAALGSVAAGGAIGATARYELGVAFPTVPTGFPWTTFAINVSGCLLIGALMVLVTEVWAGHRLVRRFLGVGVLGGFTTFSTYVVEIRQLVDAGAAGVALAYLVGTAVAALAATWAGLVGMRLLVHKGGRSA